MKNHKNIIKSLLISLFFLTSSFLSAQEKNSGELTVDEARGLYSLLENVKEQKSLFPEEVNAKNLKSLIKTEYADETVLFEKNPNALNILNCLYVEIQEKSNLIWFETFVSSDPSLSSEECIKIANEWNSSHSFTSLSFEKDVFHFQYYMSYKGGIHADNFNNSIDWILGTAFYFENHLKKILKERNE